MLTYSRRTLVAWPTSPSAFQIAATTVSAVSAANAASVVHEASAVLAGATERGGQRDPPEAVAVEQQDQAEILRPWSL